MTQRIPADFAPDPLRERLEAMDSGHLEWHRDTMQTRWTDGYSQSELDAAQERYGLRFPADLIDLLLDRRPVDGWDWRKDDEGIREMLAHPLEGILFDVEHNNLWWPEWGSKSASAIEREAVVVSVVAAAPRLIPLIGHRYIPEEPNERGNPVFSVMQSDVIYYGSDLADYFEREFHPLPGRPAVADARYIPFWSDLVDRNGLLDVR
jgi:hypothetical protein